LRGKKLDAIGGTLLQDLAPAPLDAGALDAALARLDHITPYERPRRAASRDGTPDVLRAYIGGAPQGCALAQDGSAPQLCAAVPQGRCDRPAAARHPRAPTAAPTAIRGWNIPWCCRAGSPM